MDCSGATIMALVPALRRYARSLTRDVDRADDVVQECLQRALDREHQFSPGTDLRAWLFTILRNAFIDDQRRSGRTVLVEFDEAAAAAFRHQPASQEHALDLSNVRSAFADLPAIHREALTLIVVEGLSYQAASTIIGVEVGTVKSRVSRARRTLLEATGAGPRHADAPDEWRRSA